MHIHVIAFCFMMLLKLVTGFAFIMAYLNISGRTQFSQMNAIDLIGNFILGGIIGGAIYSMDMPFYVYVFSLLIGTGTLLLVNVLSRKFYLLRNITIGRPIPIIKDGHFLMDNILNKQNKVDMLNIASQLNIQGICSFDVIQYAQIEPNGTLTAICDKHKLPSNIICYKGELRHDELQNIGQSDKTVLKDMKKHGIKDLAEVFLGEYKDGRFKYVTNDGAVFPKKRAKSMMCTPTATP